jgi:hypothetical protein
VFIGRRREATLTAAVCAAIGFWACRDGATGTDDERNITNPAVLEASMEDWFAPTVEGVIDGLTRLLAATSGGPANGVVITPTGANSFQGQVSVDLDGNGSRESTVQGHVSGDIGSGAAISITGLTQAGTPGLSLSASLTLTETSPVTVLLDNLQASLSVERSTGNLAQATATDGSLMLDVASGTPTGFVQVRVSEEGRELPLSLNFESSGAGGWRVVVTGTGVNFTLP